MSAENEPEEQADDGPIEFGLSDEDLEAIAAGKSKVVPDLPPDEDAAYSIENAPVAKSIMPADAFIPPPSTEEFLKAVEEQERKLKQEREALLNEDADEGDEPGQ